MPRTRQSRAGAVVIVRTVTFATEVPADHPAVIAQASGDPVPASLLPPELLGRDRDVVTSSTWHLEAPGGRGPRSLITVDRSR